MVDIPRYMCVYISMWREREQITFCLVRYNKNIFSLYFWNDLKTHKEKKKRKKKTHKGNIRYIGLTTLNQLYTQTLKLCLHFQCVCHCRYIVNRHF